MVMQRLTLITISSTKRRGEDDVNGRIIGKLLQDTGGGDETFLSEIDGLGEKFGEEFCVRIGTKGKSHQLNKESSEHRMR